MRVTTTVSVSLRSSAIRAARRRASSRAVTSSVTTAVLASVAGVVVVVSTVFSCWQAAVASVAATSRPRSFVFIEAQIKVIKAATQVSSGTNTAQLAGKFGRGGRLRRSPPSRRWGAASGRRNTRRLPTPGTRRPGPLPRAARRGPSARRARRAAASAARCP